MAIKEAGNITKLAGEKDLSANSITKIKNDTQEAVRVEMVEQMGEAFDNLSMAATAKKTQWTPWRSQWPNSLTQTPGS